MDDDEGERPEGRARMARGATGSRATGGRKPSGGRPGSVRWSAELGRGICARVARGELLYAILREPGMPSAQSVRTWARERADFGACLAQARADGGRAKPGGVWSYSRETAEAIYDRLCEGESLTAIAADPVMPCLSTLFYWRHRIPEFEELVQRGKAIQAERFCDLGWELAMQATPETAYLTHVRLTQLRWTAGVMAPRVFRLKPVEPATAPRTLTVAIRRFTVEIDPQTGEKKVVGHFPNPETGEVEREDTPGWRPPPGVVSLPARAEDG